MRNILLIVLIGSTWLFAHGEYMLKINKGKYPENVRIENLNGETPLPSGYKNGWTEEGWTAGDYGNRKNVALAPSYMAEGKSCESALTLPSMTIEEGEWLSWEGCEVYPLRKESYTVELLQSGNPSWKLLGEYTEDSSNWNKRMICLDEYAGKECVVRFVCRSANGYMLALSNIVISKPNSQSFYCINQTPKLIAIGELEDGLAYTDISVTNTGSTIANAKIELLKEEAIAAEIEETDEWKTGETRSYTLPLPLSSNKRVDYKISIMPQGGAKQTLTESFVYCTSFKRKLFVDKATGMWCNNCPVGTLALTDLEAEYGNSIISVETHNGDLLANDIYFKWLGYYSIPRFELNRENSTEGEGTNKFADQICQPTEMGIMISDLEFKEDGLLGVCAKVNTSESFISTNKTYRIGYVLTRDVMGDENKKYYQSNNCTIAKYKQYYYLPSRIPYDLCYFPNVSIPSPIASSSADPAFTGIEGSLPQSIAAEESYSYSWDIPLPEGFSNFSGMRLVAFILDLGKKTIVNATAVNIEDCADVEKIPGNEIYSGSNGIYSIDGRRLTEVQEPGIYIINGKKVLKKHGQFEEK